MSAAGKISRLAIGDPTVKPSEEIYDAKFDAVKGSRNEQLNEDLPFGSQGGMSVKHYFPVDAEYSISLRFVADLLSPVNGLAELPTPDLYVVKKFVPAGLHTLGAAAPRSDVKAEVELPAGPRGLAAAGTAGRSNQVVMDMFLDRERLQRFDLSKGPSTLSRMVISGPFNITDRGNTASRAKLFICRPTTPAEELPCARRILANLAHRAFRRPVTKADVDPLYAFYRTGRTGADFDTGIAAALRAILVAPDFLFRTEQDPTGVRLGQVYRASDVDLASRLSFFLWSSIPDEELLGVAEQGKLKDPPVLRRQVMRMLNDPRAEALVNNFAGQWLQVRNVETVRPDVEIFDFDESLRQAFVKETTLFVDRIVREDRSLLDLLDADYTFLNQRLAEHYGVPNVYGSQFRRVTLTDTNRRGLLGQGSILTVTSYPNRTSVVQRGKWVLENLLGSPPPPPPPNVPDLKAAPHGKVLSMRQQMEVHRANPICASCHGRMDPIGFALENYDGVGRWRDADAGGTDRRHWHLARRHAVPGAGRIATAAAHQIQGRLRSNRDREDADLRAWPWPRVLRLPDRSCDCPRRREGRLSHLVPDPRHREQHAVSDAEGVRAMNILQNPLPRRTFLRGLGATMALPLLDSMVPSSTARAAGRGAGSSGLRLHARTGSSAPATRARAPSCGRRRPPAPNFEFSPTMKALEPFREQVNVFSGLAQVNGRALGDGPGDHARATATFLTGVHPYKTGGADFKLGISADQIAAKELGKYTQLSSLELGLEPQPLAGNCDSGYTCAYMSMSWRGPTSPLPAEINPRTVFERLFGDGDSTDAAARTSRLAAPEERARLRHRHACRACACRLGAGDKRKLEEYLESVRDIERRIQLAEEQIRQTQLPLIDRPSAIPRRLRAIRAADDRHAGRRLADRT